jgi:anti-anti-sigma factor
MTTISVWPVDGKGIAQALEQARETLDGADAEVVLDFTSVRRMDPAALRALEDLSATAGDRAVKLALRGVSAEVYKVLKLTKLASRFAFLG